MDVYQPRDSSGRRNGPAAYGWEQAVKLAQMKDGNISAFLNAQNYTFLCAAALVEKYLPLIQKRSEDTALPFSFPSGHLDAMRTISEACPETFGYQYMLHRPFYLARPDLTENEKQTPEADWKKVILSNRFQMPAENAA